MNTIQKQYAIAKANYDALLKQKSEMLHPYESLLDSDEGLEDYADLEMTVEDVLNLSIARKVLKETEAALIDWAFEAIQRSSAFRPEHRETLETILNHRHNPIVHHRLVDLSSRLSLD